MFMSSAENVTPQRIGGRVTATKSGIRHQTGCTTDHGRRSNAEHAANPGHHLRRTKHDRNANHRGHRPAPRNPVRHGHDSERHHEDDGNRRRPRQDVALERCGAGQKRRGLGEREVRRRHDQQDQQPESPIPSNIGSQCSHDLSPFFWFVVTSPRRAGVEPVGGVPRFHGSTGAIRGGEPKWGQNWPKPPACGAYVSTESPTNSRGCLAARPNFRLPDLTGEDTVQLVGGGCRLFRSIGLFRGAYELDLQSARRRGRSAPANGCRPRATSVLVDGRPGTLARFAGDSGTHHLLGSKRDCLARRACQSDV